MHSNNAKPIEGAKIYEEISPGEGEPICTGDLFLQIEAYSKPDGAGVVLTPQCDLHQGKIEWVKLALVDFSRIFPVRYDDLLEKKQPLLRLKSPW